MRSGWAGKNWPWMIAVLLLAAAPRIVWYQKHGPDLPPDTYGYLNVAREWRGQRAAHGTWDDRSQLPSDNLAARTPGYPLFLNLVFALTGHTRTPDASLASARLILGGGAASGARADHLRHLGTDEDVRAVQAAQHVLGIVGTVLLFLTVRAWGAPRLVAAAATLMAIGWNPVWIVTLEPAIIGEALAGVLLISAVWLASTRHELATDVVVTVIATMGFVVRPAMAFAAVPVVVYVACRQRQHALGLPVVAAAGVIVSLVVVNNGVRYGYWGISSLGGTTFLSHANDHPDGLREPAREAALQFHPYLAGGSSLQFQMATEGGRPFLEVSRELDYAATGYVVDHPIWYLQSVNGAMIDFFSPPFRYVGGDRNALRQRLPVGWIAISVFATAVLAAGLAAIAMNVPGAAKLGAAAFLVSAIGTSLLAHTENRRFAAPLVPLTIASGVFAIDHLVRANSRR